MTKQLIPKRRFKGFEGEWITSYLGELYSFKNGLNKSKEYFGIGTPIVNYTDVFHNRAFKKNQLEGKVLVNDKELRGFEVREGDIFFTRTSEVLEEIGYPSVALGVFQNTVFSGFLIRARAIKEPDFLNNLFKSYVFYTKSFRQEMVKKSSMTTRALTSGTALSDMKFTYPNSQLEQQKIGEFFKVLDARIANQERKIKKIKAIKQAYLTEMFPQEGKEIPLRRFSKFIGSWKQKKIQELGAVITGSTPSTKNPNYYSENGMIWVTPTDIEGRITFDTEKKLSLEGQKKSRIAPKGTILITSIASIGKNTILGVEGSFNQQINALIPKKGMDSYFLFASSYWWSVRLKQMASEGTMQIVNKSEFSNLSTLLPTLEEQQKIGEFFKMLDEKIEAEEKKLEKLKKMKEAFLEEMFV